MSFFCERRYVDAKKKNRRKHELLTLKPVSPEMLRECKCQETPTFGRSTSKSEISQKRDSTTWPRRMTMRHASCSSSLAEPYQSPCSTVASDQRVPKAGNRQDLYKRSMPNLQPAGRKVSKDDGVQHQVSDAKERYRRLSWKAGQLFCFN